MNEQVAVKDQAAIDAAAKVADYEHGWSSDIEQEFGPKGLSEDTVRYISGKKNEPEWMLDWRLKAYRHWLTMESAGLGQAGGAADRLPGRLLLRRAQGEEGTGQPGRGRSRKSCASMPSWASRSKSKSCSPGWRARAGWRWMRCSIRCQSRRRFARNSRRPGSSSAAYPRRSANIPSWCGAGWGEWCPCHDNYFSGAELRGFFGWDVCLHSRGRALPDGAFDLFPHQRRQNTGQFERTLIIAEGKGSYCLVSGRLHGAASATKTSCMPPWWNWWRWTMPRLNIRPCRTGIPATKTAKGGIYNFVTKRGAVPGRKKLQDFAGRRSKPDRRGDLEISQSCMLAGR